MKLIKTTSAGGEYFINAVELQLLESVLQKFPFTPFLPGQISRAAKDAQAQEREKLLNEALADHRQEMKRTARGLLGSQNLKPWKKGQLLTLTPGDREHLLQILNDIRVGCWELLGRPEELEPQSPELSAQEFAWRNLMHLAGYFEHALVSDDDSEE